jgi:hypothetical protein
MGISRDTGRKAMASSRTAGMIPIRPLRHQESAPYALLMSSAYQQQASSARVSEQTYQQAAYQQQASSRRRP